MLVTDEKKNSFFKILAIAPDCGAKVSASSNCKLHFKACVLGTKVALNFLALCISGRLPLLIMVLTSYLRGMIA